MTSYGVMGQQIEQFEIFAGRFDYIAIGNTLNLTENNDGGTCDILTESSAVLSLESDQTVVAAYLYWAGSGEGDFDVTLNDIPITAERTFADQIDEPRVFFAGFADVTAIVEEAGSGVYTLAELDLTDVISTYCPSGTNFGGWAITVIFEDPDLPLNQINIFDGLENVSQFDNELTIELENLNVLDNENARIGFVAWEGDAGLAVNETLSINGNILSNPPLNPIDNQFNGTNSFLGEDGLFNMDIDVYDIENNINIGDTSATIMLTSGQDFVMINNIITVLNSQLPDGVIEIDGVNVSCSSRDIDVEYTVGNLGTDPLPAGTNIAFYVDGVFVGSTTIPMDVLPNETVSSTAMVSIPIGIPDIFEIIAVVDDDGSGSGAVVETDEENNESLPVTVNLTLIDIATPLDDFRVCDDVSNDGVAFFDLTVNGDLALGGQTGISVSYHLSSEDAMTGDSPIATPETYQNISNPQQIFVRFTLDIDPLCMRIETFFIAVETQPVIPILDDLLACDDVSNDGVVSFDLTIQNSSIEAGQEAVEVRYFTTLTDAQNNTSPIANPTSYLNLSNPQTIFVRLTNIDFIDCFDTSSFDIIVEDVPVVENLLEDFMRCDDPSNDGVDIFDISINEVLAIGNQSQITLTFHTSEADAVDGVNPIPDPENYENSTNPETIYIRMVQDGDINCFTIDSFRLELFNQPTIPALDPIEECDDSSNDGFLIFDLTQQESIIFAGQTDVMVSYHISSSDATNGINAIENPESYENSQVSETIYVRLENTVNTDCFDIGTFEITVLSIDTPQVLPELLQCNEGFDMSVFDLSLAGEDIDLITGEEITGYYLNPLDAFNEVNAIEDPFNYTNSTNPQTIYIRTDILLDDLCYNLASFELRIENCPPFVPEGFSPNNDGYNDTFEITGIKNIFDYELTIYSRLGNLIYRGDTAVPFWNGIPNEGIGGTLAPTGVYYWILRLRDDNFDDMAGWVYLNR